MKTTTTRTTITKLILAAGFAVAASGAALQASAQGYWTGPGGAVWKNSAGECWRAGYWTPAMATPECDASLAPRKAPATVVPPPPLAPKPAAKPAPAPAKPKPVVLRSRVLFPSGGAKLDSMGQFRLDTDIVNKMGTVGAVRYINIEGHTDRMGGRQFNQKLSERRADAVKKYLVGKGLDASKMETFGYGQTTPVQSCPDNKNRKALIACLEPNRRVDVEVQGAPK